MGAWFFVIGCASGSLWTVALLRGGHLAQSIAVRIARPKYAEVNVLDVGERKIQAIKEIRAITNWGLRESKEASEGHIMVLDREDGEELARRLRAVGATVATRRLRRVA